MTSTAPPSEVRLQAKPIYSAEWLTVGNHAVLDVSPSGNWLARPTDIYMQMATHIKVQALSQNIRYTIDETQASATVGFQLTAGSETLLPCPNDSISVFEEQAGAIIQYQWLR